MFAEEIVRALDKMLSLVGKDVKIAGIAYEKDENKIYIYTEKAAYIYLIDFDIIATVVCNEKYLEGRVTV